MNNWFKLTRTGGFKPVILETFCELAASDDKTKRWLRERVEGNMCKETVGEQNGGNFHVFARPWRTNCLAYVEKGALGEWRIEQIDHQERCSLKFS